MAAAAIADQDRVIVQGRYLVYEQNPTERFMMRGMAFPVSVHDKVYNEEGWISILKQLREASPYINTLRLYHIHLDGGDRDNHQMDGFYQAAAELGFYLLVPLTTASGDGVLNRGKAAPSCYNGKLFHYGARVLESVQDHPNVLGGVLGNEVLNSLRDWPAAPCLLAYARDLKRLGARLPLVYTTQHDGIGAVVTPAESAELLLRYLTCEEDRNATLDILGMNIESWCSSLQTYEEDEDGSVGSYLDLHRHLENSTIPLIFSELGCSQILFNRDNGLGTLMGDHTRARDWKQLEVIETDMVDQWSGYIAYAYDGPVDFRMTTGGPWNGRNTLTLNLDMENYVQELEKNTAASMGLACNTNTNISSPTCASVHQFLQDCCDLDLLDVAKVPSYYIVDWSRTSPRKWRVRREGRPSPEALVTVVVVVVALSIGIIRFYQRHRGKNMVDNRSPLNSKVASYDTFA